MTTDELIDDILRREGDATFTDDPDDAGGPTRYGITAGTLGAWRGLGRPATVAEVQQLREEEAREIFAARYLRPFDRVRDEALKAQLADFAVTSGTVTAIQALQQAIGVTVDGVLGPDTQAALAIGPPALMMKALVGVRCKFYSDLAERRPAARKFLRGWIIRAVSFLR